MYPCSACQRHLRCGDTLCPFCGAEQHTVGCARTTLAGWLLTVAAVFGTSACASPGETTDTTTTTTTATTTATSTSDTESESESETSTMGDGDGDSADDTQSSSLSFYAPPDEDLAQVLDCDNFAQDCPDGEKCVPFASDGGDTLDASKCVPVTGAGAPGEPCVSGGPIEGTDDCDFSSFCFNVVETDDQLIGTCAPFCQGTEDDPICDPGTMCFGPEGTTLGLCLDECHPLMQDCAPGSMCVWAPSFTCVVEPPGAAGSGEVCDTSYDACGLGLLCMDTSALSNCGGDSCCTEYCDLTDMNFVCANPSDGCEPLFEMGMAPPGYENVGVCVVPP